MTGKTFAVFRVDSKHHLVSLVSMIYPSPDWFVGVSGLELCLGNGSWVDEKILNLYPYDAGTDSGPTYISPDQPTIPKEAIRRIKPNQPNDPRSPFHDPDNKEMKPLARLYLTRQRLYEKNCESQDQETTSNTDQENANDCDVTEWQDFSGCSSTCGKGRQLKHRSYKNPSAAYLKGCRIKLTKSEDCQGNDKSCNNDNESVNESVNLQGSELRNCNLTEWTNFENCSKACGKGKETRTREYVFKANQKLCQKRYPMLLQEQQECEGQNCSGDINEENQTHMKVFIINI